jgi:hypothetical protein
MFSESKNCTLSQNTLLDADGMFTWINKQGVKSDRGFSFQFTGRFTAEYREGGKVVTLDLEAGVCGGISCIILSPDAFAQWDDGTAILIDQQARLFQNVREAMEFQGLKMVLE